MAIPNRQLFLDRFIEYNVVRYADKPKLVAILRGLTLDKLVINNFQKTQNPGGYFDHFYDVSMAGVFEGVNQKFQPASIEAGRLFAIIAKVDDENELSLKEEEGAYDFGQVDHAVILVTKGKIDDSAHVLNVVKQSLLYEIADADISYTGGIITIKNEIMDGTITIHETLFDDIPRYNGKYRCDGSVKAL